MTTPTTLSTLNTQTLGAEFPEVTLPDGSKVQTGTVGALLSNIKTYDMLYASLPNVPATRVGNRRDVKGQLDGLEGTFRTALPLLFKVGFFELFTPAEWIERSRSVARKRVGELAVEWLEGKKGEEGGK